MNIFDSAIMSFLNRFSRLSVGFDYLMGFIAFNDLVKGGILVTLLWWLWFRDKEYNMLSRERILLTLISCIVTLFLSRILSMALPFRFRPLQNPALHFTSPYGMDPNMLKSWSSFPSDHAVLFFTLVAGVLSISKKVGLWILAYVLVVICFPRVYLGLHYPTDIVGGALLGIGMANLFFTKKIGTPIARTAMRWADQNPGVFYACFFLLSCQIATLFDPVRAIFNFAWWAFHLALK